MQPKPRAYEPHRLVDAIRGHTRVLVAVALLALFGGAAVARWMVPDLQRARAGARIAFEPHAVLSRAHEEALLAAAATRAGESAEDLARRVRVSFQGRDQLLVEVRGSLAEQPGKLAEELASGYVALANTRAEVQLADHQAARTAELAWLRAARDEAQVNLTRETPPGLAQAEAQLRAQLAELDAALQAAALTPVVKAPAPAGPVRADLSDAQKKLSKLLAQGGSDGEVSALRAKIAKLQRAADAGSAGPASPLRLAALNARSEAKRAELAKLMDASAQLGSLREAVQHAEARLAQVSARPLPAPGRSERSGPVSIEPVSRRALRVVVSLLAPVLAVLLLVAFLLLRELNDLRVCEATEVAHWLGVSVLTSSAWPRRNDALESLVDVLADPALESLGTTLVLPLSEIERPLAYTLTAQLNARAQRHFLSRTGSRVTIAQDWQGELDSSRIERAAEAADRVLWVVAADAHRGEALAAKRALVKRTDGVAAVLVDAELVTVRSVGVGREFWKARSHQPEPLATVEAPL